MTCHVPAQCLKLHQPAEPAAFFKPITQVFGLVIFCFNDIYCNSDRMQTGGAHITTHPAAVSLFAYLINYWLVCNGSLRPLLIYPFLQGWWIWVQFSTAMPGQSPHHRNVSDSFATGQGPVTEEEWDVQSTDSRVWTSEEPSGFRKWREQSKWKCCCFETAFESPDRPARPYLSLW